MASWVNMTQQLVAVVMEEAAAAKGGQGGSVEQMDARTRPLRPNRVDYTKHQKFNITAGGFLLNFSLVLTCEVSFHSVLWDLTEE